LLGTIVNVIAIIAGSLCGLIFRKGIPDATNRTIMQALSLAVILIGIRGALKSDALLIVILSLVTGTLIGDRLRLEERLEGLGHWMGARMGGSREGFAGGFVTASLVYCVGAMAIVGSMESGLSGNHQTLFAKSILDGVSAIVFASTLGIGVLFSSLSVFLYQGALTLGAIFLKQFLIPDVVNQMTAVGGLLIMAIGINLLEIKRLPIANMLPGIFIPLLYYLARSLWS
jgi:uncharacterized membrane protein YqgA involved in biofilm formation